MEIKPSEISALIKAQINDYDSKLEDNDVGTVVTFWRWYCYYLWSFKCYEW